MSRRAVILSGGKGTRLKPYTVVFPKPMMPIGDYPVLEIVIRQLAKNGFNHITMAVNHQADLIKAFFGDGSKWKVKIDYSIEDKPLSTMGPLKLITGLPDNFLVMNGDILTDLNYGKFYDYHVKSNNIFTVASSGREQRTEYGVLEVNKENRIIGFKEKPIVSYEVSMGIYMTSKTVLKYIPEDEPYGFDKLILRLIKLNKQATAYRHAGYWLDIGNPDDYTRAVEEFESRKNSLLK